MANIDEKVNAERTAAQGRVDSINLRRRILETILPCADEASCLREPNAQYCDKVTCTDYKPKENYKK